MQSLLKVIMYIRLPLTISVLLLSYTATLANVHYPKIRATVGDGELYSIIEVENWTVDCLKDDEGEDTCSVISKIDDLDHGLVLGFEISRFMNYAIDMGVDVNTVPYGYISIGPYSESSHYNDYSAMITELDGEPFSGYWCALTGYENCNRGPALSQNDLEQIMTASSAKVLIMDSLDESENPSVFSEITVDLSGVAQASANAMEYGSEIRDLDPRDLIPQIEVCNLVYDGREQQLSFTFDEDDDIDKQTFREYVLGPKGSGSCPGYVTLAYLAPDATAAQRELFCLVFDEDSDELLGLQLGEQDAYRSCKAPSKSFCQRVNETKDTAIGVTGLASGTVGSAVGATTVTGTSVVMHSSGAAIVTGTSGYVAGTLGTIGATALGILTAPATIAAAAVSVVAVGGAVYYCSE